MGPINIPTMEKRAVFIHASKDSFKRQGEQGHHAL